jgi:hypothetical protein
VDITAAVVEAVVTTAAVVDITVVEAVTMVEVVAVGQAASSDRGGRTAETPSTSFPPFNSRVRRAMFGPLKAIV